MLLQAVPPKKDKTLTSSLKITNNDGFLDIFIEHELQPTLERVIVELFSSPKHTFFNYSLVQFPNSKINFSTFPFLLILAVPVIYN